MTRTLLALFVTILAAVVLHGQVGPGLRFEVTLDPSLPAQPPGRLLVVMASSDRVEPRRLIGRTGRTATPTVGVDVPALAPGDRVILDATAAAFPIEGLADLPAGEYHVQAVLNTNRDIRSPGAPGSLYSEPLQVALEPAQNEPVRLTLSRRIPDEQLPPDEEYLRFIKIRSDLLTQFHGRPIYIRAGVILPPGFEQEPERRYPLRVHIGGYGSRYTRVGSMMRPGSPFRDAWLAADAPRMVLLHLDGAGPNGDPYQVNSANNGPYGDAVTQELIPYVEREFRGIGEPHARVLDGGSTGGWVSLALQIFYPDFFNGAWASCPDGVDFSAFQLVDIYSGDSAYVDEQGHELPSARNRNGRVRFTMRHEVQMENVLGRGDSWTMSGRQWGAWNAAYGPRGQDGRPVPLWDPETGVIDRSVTRHWEPYDLRLVLEQHWDELAPKLRGKLNIWVGEMDDYYLNNAVHLLDEFLQTKPSIDARIAFGPDRGHCWTGISQNEMMREIEERITSR
ncbi:MAG TPA: esterase [Acidobacteria bacterium]|nr:esterase [Acidobacteriota bacterium]